MIVNDFVKMLSNFFKLTLDGESIRSKRRVLKTFQFPVEEKSAFARVEVDAIMWRSETRGHAIHWEAGEGIHCPTQTPVQEHLLDRHVG